MKKFRTKWTGYIYGKQFLVYADNKDEAIYKISKQAELYYATNADKLSEEITGLLRIITQEEIINEKIG